MRIGVTSQNFRTITGHAGKTRRFLIYDVSPGGEPREVERLDLPPEMSLHHYHGTDHPLFALDVLITQGHGQGFVDRLSRHGVQVVATSAADPLAAATAWAAGEPLPAALPHDHAHGGDKGGEGQPDRPGHGPQAGARLAVAAPAVKPRP